MASPSPVLWKLLRTRLSSGDGRLSHSDVVAACGDPDSLVRDGFLERIGEHGRAGQQQQQRQERRQRGAEPKQEVAERDHHFTLEIRRSRSEEYAELLKSDRQSHASQLPDAT